VIFDPILPARMLHRCPGAAVHVTQAVASPIRPTTPGISGHTRPPRTGIPTRARQPARLVNVWCKAQKRKDEQFQFDQATAKKGFRYIKVVTKYAFGVDIDAYIPLIVAGGSLLALITFGLSGLFIVAASALGVILASSLIFFSFGWLFIPLVSFMVIGALAAGVGSFLLFPAVALGGVFALVSTLSSLAFERLDDKMIDDVIESLDEDVDFDREELERFDARLRTRTARSTGSRSSK
jgi:hypothetical protein